ncbi:recombinase family protein [Emticicia aquatilis]
MILKELRIKGLIIPKQTISSIWRNPFYCGVSTNSLLENEEAIKGNWEAIISISDFFKLEKILKKNKSGYKHNKVDECKPLNAFLKCHQCENKLTSYENKKKKLFYYKCNYCKGVSLNAITKPKSNNIGANELFIELLDKYKINQSFSFLIEKQMKKIYTAINTMEANKEKDIKNKIKNLESELNSVHIRFGKSQLTKKVYDLTVQSIEEELSELNKNLKNTNPKLSNQEDLIKKSLESLQNIGNIWVSSTFEVKKALQNTLFPSGVFFDKKNHTYLTKDVNSFLLVSNYLSSNYECKKNETFNQIDEKSHLVAGTGLEPVTFGL